MAVTDDIAVEIETFCKELGTTEFSREILYEYIGPGRIDEMVDEIVKKLKAKGIVVGS